jgi:hypothetical protein
MVVAYRDKKVVPVSLCVFRAPLQPKMDGLKQRKKSENQNGRTSDCALHSKET